MNVRITEKHERVLYASISKDMLVELILAAVAAKSDLSLSVLRNFGSVEIEKNMEGSPEYQSGYKATVRATIPLASVAVDER